MELRRIGDLRSYAPAARQSLAVIANHFELFSAFLIKFLLPLNCRDIAAFLPGRTENSVKNEYHSLVRKRNSTQISRPSSYSQKSKLGALLEYHPAPLDDFLLEGQTAQKQHAVRRKRIAMWTKEEDDHIEICKSKGVTSWIEIARDLPERTSKQCRERWVGFVLKYVFLHIP
jgi:hypothetical protein